MKKSILIVEKDKAVADRLKECLQSADYEICGVMERGEDVIPAVRELRPSLLIFGLELAGELDGAETANIVSSRYKTPHLYLIGDSESELIQRIQGSQPMGYLTLPLEPEKLMGAVDVAFKKLAGQKSGGAWFESALDHIDEGVITTDRDGIVLRMNAKAEVLSGCDFVSAAGSPLGEVLNLSEDSEREDPAREVLQSGGVVEFSAAIGEGESAVELECKGAPHISEGGEVTGTVIVLREKKEAPEPEVRIVKETVPADTERGKRPGMEYLVASLTLPLVGVDCREFERKFRSVLGKLGEKLGVDYCAALTTTLMGAPGEYSTVCSWGNSGKGLMGALLGFCANESTWWHGHMKKNHGVILKSRDDIPSDKAEEAVRLEATGFESIIALPLDDTNGGFLVMCSAEAHDWDDETIELMRSLSMVFGDVMRRNQEALQREARTNEQIQSRKLSAIGKLSGGIAHDFNNMLVPIIGYSDVIIERMESEGEPSEEIVAIRSAAESAAALTRQLLSFARKQILKKAKTNFHEIVTEARSSLKKHLGEGVGLEVYSSPNTWNMIADRSQIEQILSNLCVNAREAMNGKGSVIVNVENVQLPAGNYIYLGVEDTGPGMDRGVLERIFEPFYSTKENNGTGLGLSVVQGIVEQHEGRISVDSEPGRGSRFNIWIPAAPGAEAEVEEVRPVTARSLVTGGQETILLVEDEKSVIQFVSQALSKKGYQVFTAMSVAEAYQVYEENGGLFDLIFSDAMLPDGTGMEVVKKLLGEDESLRALLSSGYTDHRSLVEMANEPRISFLHKPYSLPELYKTVRAVLDDEEAALLS